MVPMILCLYQLAEDNREHIWTGAYRINNSSRYHGAYISLDKETGEYWISDNFSDLLTYSYIHGYLADADSEVIKLDCALLKDPIIILGKDRIYMIMDIDPETAVLTAYKIDSIIVTASSEDKDVLDYTNRKEKLK